METKTLPHEMKSSDYRFELKAADDSGKFVGFASVYGNVDDGGDVIEAGAFQKFESTRDGNIRILQQHDDTLPLGQGKISDTEVGLKIEGQLNLKIPRVAEVYEFMKDGTIDGLSVGYTILPGGAAFDKGVRRLTSLKLWEVSAVMFGMNSLARIDAVKALDRIGTIRELEEFLRDAGFSLRKAKAIAKDGFAGLSAENAALRDAGDEKAKAVLEELLVALKRRPALT
jgi:HK97 family phage prohead protease